MAALCAALVLALSRPNGIRPDLITYLVVGGMLAGALIWSIRKTFWWMTDEVWETDRDLLIRRNGDEARVSFNDIERVELVPRYSVLAVGIDFSRDIPHFGREITFWPVGGRHASSEQVERLVARLREKATRGRAA